MALTTIDVDRFQTLVEINTLINSDFSDLRGVLQRIVESATRLTNGEASSLLLHNPKTDKLYFEIALGAKSDEIQRFSLDMGEGIAGWVAEKNRSLIVNEAADDPRHQRQIAQQVGYRAQSILAVPMRVRERCIGVLEILNKQDGEPFNDVDLHWLEIFANQAAIAIQNARTFEAARTEIDILRDRVASDAGYHTMVWKSPRMAEIVSLVEKVAPTDSTVLILGESGVGKELIAEQIHLGSPRTGQPFVRVNCAALPAPLLESELFGHVKGAFTDAVADRRGRFELANRGTLFLDEIGDLPLGLQAKLLRAIQERTFERVGSSDPVEVDVRIIAATNRDVEELVRRGEFRSDLYYRLNVLPIIVPPLRERREDISELSDFFLKRFRRETNKRVTGFSPDALEQLVEFDWPGNVRELENAIERAVVMTSDEIITPQDLLLQRAADVTAELFVGKTLKDGISAFKREFIRSALQRHAWSHTDTAEELGVQRSYLSKLVKDLGIGRRGEHER